MSRETEGDSRSYDEYWREFLTSGESNKLEKRGRRFFALLPENPRCKACNAPFEGFGAPLVKVIFGKYQSTLDPRFCNHCTDFMRTHPGGAEIEISMLFADVRGSTTLAENRPPAEFSRFINRFYQAATDVLLDSDAMIDRLIGDEVVGIYFPGFAGPQHAARAIDAALEILRVTGHGDKEGPWIPVGAGVHTGLSYVGTVGSKSGALLRGYGVQVVSRTLSTAAAYDCCHHNDFFHGVVDWYLYRLGLRSWPVSQANFRNWQEDVPSLELLEQISTSSDGSGKLSSEQRLLLYAFVEFLMQRRAALGPGLLQRPWLTVDNVQLLFPAWPLTELERAWRDFVKERASSAAFEA